MGFVRYLGLFKITHNVIHFQHLFFWICYKKKICFKYHLKISQNKQEKVFILEGENSISRFRVLPAWELGNSHDRSKSLFVSDEHVVLDVGEDGRLEEVAGARTSLASEHQRRSLLLCLLTVWLQLTQVPEVILRPLLSVPVQWITYHLQIHTSLQYFLWLKKCLGSPNAFG